MDPNLGTYGEGMYDRTSLAGIADEPLSSVAGEDPELHAFITQHLGTSLACQLEYPAASLWARGYGGDESHLQLSSLYTTEKLGTRPEWCLRSSPASTNWKKRKYGSTGELDQLYNPMQLPARVVWDTDSGDESAELRKAAAIPASPALQIQTTPMKRSASASLTCTLMPFSLVKAFPSRDSLSLADVNRRIQSIAEAEAACTPQSSHSSSSGCLMATQAVAQPAYRPHILVDRIAASSNGAVEAATLPSQSSASQDSVG